MTIAEKAALSILNGWGIQKSQQKVQSWYENTDITEPEILAAAVIEWGFYVPVTYAELARAAAFHFPQTPEELQYADWISCYEEDDTRW